MRPEVAVASTTPDQDADDVAGKVRASLGITLKDQSSWDDDYRAYRSWRQVIEDQHVLVLQMTLDLDELRGFSLTERGVPTIVVSSSDEPRPRIFTLFHEYAHVLLGTGGICLPEPGRTVAGRRNVERFCNSFAGAILVPLQALLEHPRTLELRSIAEAPPDAALDPLTAAFRVSPPVIWMRLRQANVISAAVSQQKWAQWESRRARTKATRPTRSQPKRSRARRRVYEGGAYVSVVLDAHERDLIGYPEALDYLDIRSKDFGGVASLVGRRGV
jgi:Zn-dependent peptidase ImmA (M78 family)